jgi:hypothetical protein
MSFEAILTSNGVEYAAVSGLVSTLTEGVLTKVV